MRLRLTTLEPKFIRYETREQGEYKVTVPLPEAQGLFLLCPVCFTKNNGPVGTHGIDVTFRDRGAADHQGSHNRAGVPSRWAVSGDSFENLTLQPSIDISEPDGSGCGWHGHITNGEVT